MNVPDPHRDPKGDAWVQILRVCGGPGIGRTWIEMGGWVWARVLYPYYEPGHERYAREDQPRVIPQTAVYAMFWGRRMIGVPEVMEHER